MPKKKKLPKCIGNFQEFYLLRDEDASGVSGTGIVARGIISPLGRVFMEWQTVHHSWVFFDTISDVELIHGHGGKTRVVLGNPSE